MVVQSSLRYTVHIQSMDKEALEVDFQVLSNFKLCMVGSCSILLQMPASVTVLPTCRDAMAQISSVDMVPPKAFA